MTPIIVILTILSSMIGFVTPQDTKFKYTPSFLDTQKRNVTVGVANGSRVAVNLKFENESIPFRSELYMSLNGIPQLGVKFLSRNNDTQYFAFRVGILKLIETNDQNGLSLSNSPNTMTLFGPSETSRWSSIQVSNMSIPVNANVNATVFKFETKYSRMIESMNKSFEFTIDAMVSDMWVNVSEGVELRPGLVKVEMNLTNWPYQFNTSSNVHIVTGTFSKPNPNSLLESQWPGLNSISILNGRGSFNWSDKADYYTVGLSIPTNWFLYSALNYAKASDKDFNLVESTLKNVTEDTDKIQGEEIKFLNLYVNSGNWEKVTWGASVELSESEVIGSLSSSATGVRVGGMNLVWLVSAILVVLLVA
ncbi:hypothetical protein BKA69DRAFT_1123081 [Paraphysoderma sedebokerense]|nr:hypothetical protein BKA69DRAFT_1123081 [Paraphysoderma sedebokerense]